MKSGNGVWGRRGVRTRRVLLLLAGVLALAASATLAIARPGGHAGGDPSCHGRTATIVGTAAGGPLKGTADDDVILAASGSDAITGGGGDDVICARPDDDDASGGDGNDYIRGGRGDDKIYGGGGRDEIRGGIGADEIFGEEGADQIDGGTGIDACDGGPGRNVLRHCEPTSLPDEPGQGDSAPIATDDSGATGEDSAAALDVLTNDSDPDGDRLEVSSVDTAGSRGSATVLAGGGKLRYDPGNAFQDLGDGQTRTDSFTYRASDGERESNDATVTVTVTGSDDSPRAVDDAKTVAEASGATTIDVRANDTDVDGGPKTITAKTNGAHGTVAITNGGNDLTYTPAAGYCNDGSPADTFTYALNGGSTATVSVTVTCFDDPPVAVGDSKTIAEDDPATTIDVRANDTDVDGGPKTITAKTNGAHGTVVITNGGNDLTYTPDANYCNDGSPADTFTYTLNGGSTATVTVTVTCVDDGPLAVDDSATLAEDDPATTIDVRANDTDVDAGPKTITTKTNGAHGTVAITNGGDDLTYTPDADYCNDPPGTTRDTFTYALNGGSTATVSVTVTCSDDAPVAVDDSKTIAEDGPATTIDVRANDTDVDGGTKTITAKTNGAHGTVAITNGGNDLTYTPDADYCNSSPSGSPADTFTYTLNGGSTATVSVTVTCVDDPPVAVDDSKTIAEDDPATTIDVRANDTDVDGGPKTITAKTNGSHGTVAITNGGDDLTYTPDADYCNSSPSGSPADTFTYALNGGSTATVSVTVTCSNDAPTVTTSAGATAYTEGASAVTVDDAVSASDIDDSSFEGATVEITAGLQLGDELVFTNQNGITGSYSGGVLTLTGTSSVADYVTALRSVRFQSSNDDPSAKTVTFRVNDGDAQSGTAGARKDISITGVNDPPALSGIETTPAGYTENGTPVAVTSTLVVGDPDGDQIQGATVKISGNFSAGQDSLAFTPGNGITGSFAGDTLTLTGNASAASYQTALRSVTFQSSSDDPSTAQRTISFQVTDAIGADSNVASRALSVTRTNDPPNAVDDTGTTDEDTVLDVSAPGVLANDTDPDSADSKAVTKLNGSALTGSPASLTKTTAKGATVTLRRDGSYSYDPRAVAAFQALDDGESTTDTFEYTMADGAGLEDTATVTITITGLPEPPVAVDDSFTAVGNTGLFVGTTRPATQAGRQISGSLLSNDSGSGTLVAQAVTGAATTEGGTITIGSDGKFTYQPQAGDTGISDTYTYRVCDVPTCDAGTSASHSDTGTLTIPIVNQVWYVKNTATAIGADGTSDAPYTTLAQAQTASGTGDTTYAFGGDGTATGMTAGYTMDSGERLIGEASDLAFDPDGAGPIGTETYFTGTAANRPKITDNNADVVELASGATVRGLQLDPQGTGGGISAGSGVTAGTVDNVKVIDTGVAGTQPGLELDGTSGTFNVSDLTIDNSAATGTTSGSAGVRLNGSTANFAAAGTISVTTKGAPGLVATNTALGTSTFDDITVTGSGAGGVVMTNTTGTTTLGDDSGTDLSLTTTSGATPALSLATAGTVNVGSGGTDDVRATGGPAVDVTGTTTSGLAFDDVDSTNSANDGVNLSGLGSGGFSATSGDIGGEAGIAFDLDGGSGAVSYPGNIANGAGASAEITGRTGGTVVLSGSIADSNDFGGGITVSGNTGGSTEFSGGSKALDTGSADAVSILNDTGHSVRFTGGGLVVSSAAGRTLYANGGGTVSVTGSGNRLSSTTGTALGVSGGTTIGSDDINLEKVSSNGAASGILLSGTGSVGGLNVTGTGSGACATTPGAASCTGGTIVGSTGAGISLTNVGGGVDLTRMQVATGGDDGITGSTVNGFSLASSSVTGNGNGTLESGLDFTALTGTVGLNGDTISGNASRGVQIVNDLASGTLTATVTNGTISNHTGSFAEDGMLVEGDNAGTINLDVEGTTFANNRDDQVQVTTDGSNTVHESVTVNGATMTNPVGTVNAGVTLNPGGNSVMKAALTNNTITGAKIEAITVDTPGSTASPQPATIDATITGNVIGTAATANSGASQGNGMGIRSNGTAAVRASIQNNQIYQYANAEGLLLTQNDGNGSLDATVRGNTISNPSPAALNGILVITGGAAATDAGVSCFDLGGSTAAQKNAVSSGGVDSGGAGAIDQDIRLRQRDGSTLKLPGYAGAANGGGAGIPQVASYLQPRNDTGGTPTVSGNSNNPTGGSITGGTCSLPQP